MFVKFEDFCLVLVLFGDLSGSRSYWLVGVYGFRGFIVFCGVDGCRKGYV